MNARQPSWLAYQPTYSAKGPEMQPADVSFSLRILIVDDLHDSANSLAILIDLWGYKTVVVYDGVSALDVASANPPDVVLLDLGLPGMDGYELARQLRRLPGMDTALLVAISGHGREAEVQRCKEAGIDCHFLKPVDLDELQKVLAKAEKLGREQRQLAC
jgi:two-component system, chemotaxis family, CheB/CheR fusion protein